MNTLENGLQAHNSPILRAEKTTTQTITNNVVTAITSYDKVTSAFRDPETAFSGGILKVGPLDAGLWLFVADANMSVVAGTALFSYVYRNSEREVGGMASAAVLTTLAPGDAVNGRLSHDCLWPEDLDRFQFIGFRIDG